MRKGGWSCFPVIGLRHLYTPALILYSIQTQKSRNERYGSVMHGWLIQKSIAIPIGSWLLYCVVFIHFYSASYGMRLSEALSTIAIDTVSVLHSEAQQAIASEWLVQGPYVAARAGFEPTTLRSKGMISVSSRFIDDAACRIHVHWSFSMDLSIV